LDQNAQIFDTDKFVWLQARQVWMFATLHMELNSNENWLAIAEKGM
jgi:N-acylglucosamine 2-epimerase